MNVIEHLDELRRRIMITGITFVLSFLTGLAGVQFETFFTAEKYFRFMLNLSLSYI